MTLSEKYQKEYREKYGVKQNALTSIEKNKDKIYYITSRLKGFVKVDTKNRRVEIPSGKVPPIFQNYINQLKQYGYSIQIIIQ